MTGALELAGSLERGGKLRSMGERVTLGRLDFSERFTSGIGSRRLHFGVRRLEGLFDVANVPPQGCRELGPQYFARRL
jgi:hypothetical protein